MRHGIILLACFFSVAPVFAAEPMADDAADYMQDAGTHFTAIAALAAGGDELATISFTNGDSQDIKAGSGVYLGGGFLHNFAAVPVSVQVTLGYFVADTAATNTQARFSRYPLDAMVFYRNAGHRFGAGLTYHLSPTLDLDQLGGTYKFENAQGLVLEYGYKWFGIRYTTIDYEAKGFAYTASGNHLSIQANWGFSGW